MAFLLEIILNMVGFSVGLAIGAMSLIGFRNTGSATLFRLSIAFLAIGAGFGVVGAGFIIEDAILRAGDIQGWVQTTGIGIQTVGYFFIAFSHSIKAFLPKSRYFRAVAFPLFVSFVHIEHILRSVSFILLAYGTIETILSCIQNRRRETGVVAAGLAMLALGEFLSWYSFVFPESLLYMLSNVIKIAGLVAMFIPISRIPFVRVRPDPE